MSIFGNEWAQPTASRWGHHGPTVLMGVFGTMATLAVLPVPYPANGKPFVSLTFIVLMLITYVEMRKHDRGLCERCVSDFPLNPAQDAETYRRRLRLVHALAEKRAAAWFLAAIVVACLLPHLVPGWLAVPALGVWLASLAVLIYYVQSGQTHRKLQPWCPECGNQGGSDNIEAPEPMPMGGLSK
jgi:hypothetical protein